MPFQLVDCVIEFLTFLDACIAERKPQTHDFVIIRCVNGEADCSCPKIG
jgi:hypothetical protein